MKRRFLALALFAIGPALAPAATKHLCDVIEFLPAYHGEVVSLRGELAVAK